MGGAKHVLCVSLRQVFMAHQEGVCKPKGQRGPFGKCAFCHKLQCNFCTKDVQVCKPLGIFKVQSVNELGDLSGDRFPPWLVNCMEGTPPTCIKGQAFLAAGGSQDQLAH